jgi:PTH1 family peptidyl-tRNA hydrolase
MKVVVGLGNPGSEYDGTRHNVGFEVLEELARRWQVGTPKRKFQAEIAEANFRGEKVVLVAPQTFMNLSGQSVAQVLKFYQVEPIDLLVICDDMNLPLARLRFRTSGSAGGQKGLKNIIESLATEAVPRLRFGIGRPPGQGDSVNFVLARFRKTERPDVDAAVIRSADGVETWIEHGMAMAMNQFNAEEKSEDA